MVNTPSNNTSEEDKNNNTTKPNPLSSAPDHGGTDEEMKPTSKASSEPFEAASRQEQETTVVDVPKDKVPKDTESSNANDENGEEGDKKEEKEEPPKIAASEIFKYADNTEMALMIGGGIAAFFNGCGMPAFSEVFGRMIDALVGQGKDIEDVMSNLSSVLAIIGAVVFVFSSLQVATWGISAERQARRIREKYFESALRQELGFHDEEKPGGLSARLFGDITVLRNGINDKLASGIQQGSLFIAGFGLGFYRSWRLSLVMIGTLPLIAAAGAIMSKVLSESTQQARAGYARAGDLSDEVMKNIRTVQAFGTEDQEVQKFNEALEEAAEQGTKKEFYTTASTGLVFGVLFSTYSIAFYFASYLVNEGYNTVGEIVSVFFANLMGSFGLGLIFPALGALAEAQGAAWKVYSVIDRESRIDPFTSGKKLDNLQGEISFENITFSYPTRLDEKLFSEVSFTIEAGKHVAFSGASGCGKSTFIGLAQRLYDPLEGCVKVDGVDLKEIDLDWWRTQLGVVSQEPTLFTGSIKDNILMGRPDATDDEVKAACKQSNIHDTIMTLPEKYDTSVGTVGGQLSGGQKQRIAIARALIRKPRVLILDEATSALDRQSEIEVQRAIDDLMKSEDGSKLTIMVIAHRLATIRNVDQIFFIENDGATGSRISETGSFDELIKKGGAFAAMASRQSKSMATLEEDKEELQKEHEERMRQESFDPEKFVPDAEKNKEKEKTELEKQVEQELEEVDASMGRVFSMMPKKWPVVIGLFGSLLSGAVYPLYAVVFSRILEVIGQREDDQITLWACMFLVVAGSAFIGWSLQGFYGYAGEELTVILRREAFRAILRQDMTFFDMPGRDTGSMQQLLAGDCEAVHQLWGPSIGTKIQTACNLFAGIIIGFIYSWKVALVTLSVVPVMIIAGAVQQMMIMGFGQAAGEQTATVVTESLQNIRTVTAFNIHKRQMELYSKSLETNEQDGIKLAIYAGAIFGFTQFSFYGVFSLTLWYGGKLIANGELTFFDIMVSSFAILMGAMGAGEAAGFAAKLKDSDTAAKKVFSLIDRKPNIDMRDAGSKDIKDCELAFDDVKFIYPSRPDAVVLKGFSTTIGAGKSRGFLGSTGSGKSTVIQLLLRYYDPVEGDITVDGVNLKDLDLRHWRDQIAAVLQEPSLFSGTVKENIKYINPDATDEEVHKYAKLAAIHDDILAMKDGYDTQVGYSGRNLSGGQKQRVALARALMSRKKILLLDEATSALDQHTEALVQDGLSVALKETPMTVVSIAHRLTTIRHSDKIMLLDNGVVLEEGTHDELIAKNGEYKKRWETFMAGTRH